MPLPDTCRLAFELISFPESFHMVIFDLKRPKPPPPALPTLFHLGINWIEPNVLVFAQSAQRANLQLLDVTLLRKPGRLA